MQKTPLPFRARRVRVVDEEGRMVLDAKAASEPDAIADALREAAREFVRVDLETGSPSQWLFFGLKVAGLPAVCLEARYEAVVCAR